MRNLAPSAHKGGTGGSERMSRQGKIAASLGDGAVGTHRQVAALCWRMHGGAPEVLLITSRDTGRWIVPKGWPMADRSAAATAAQEAWEEAGVRGEIDEASLGAFHYPKLYDDADPRLCKVEVFALRVEGLAHRYPERGQRRRKWFSLAKAARRVGEPELRTLILDFAGDASAAGAGTAATPS